MCRNLNESILRVALEIVNNKKLSFLILGIRNLALSFI